MSDKLNIPALIDRACGAHQPSTLSQNAKIELLAKRINGAVGMEKIEPKSIKKWVERKQIPADRLVDLAILARYSGRPIDLYKFINYKAGKEPSEDDDMFHAFG